MSVDSQLTIAYAIHVSERVESVQNTSRFFARLLERVDAVAAPSPSIRPGRSTRTNSRRLDG